MIIYSIPPWRGVWNTIKKSCFSFFCVPPFCQTDNFNWSIIVYWLTFQRKNPWRSSSCRGDFIVLIIFSYSSTTRKVTCLLTGVTMLIFLAHWKKTESGKDVNQNSGRVMLTGFRINCSRKKNVHFVSQVSQFITDNPTSEINRNSRFCSVQKIFVQSQFHADN